MNKHKHRLSRMITATGIILGLSLTLGVPTAFATDTDSSMTMSQTSQGQEINNTADSAQPGSPGNDTTQSGQATGQDSGSPQSTRSSTGTTTPGPVDGKDASSNDTSETVKAPRVESPIAAPDVTINDELTEDSASVSSLTITQTQTGTAPFDKDDARGNDSTPSNDRVRSFDSISYTVKAVITPDDPMQYYRKGRIGFRVTIPLDDQKAGFDMDSVNWADQSKGYEPKTTNENGQQTLTVYYKADPTSSSPTRIPGTIEVPFIINVKAMTEGESISPTFESWTVPNMLTNRVASVQADPVVVTSYPSYNIRMDNEMIIQTSGGPNYWNFSTNQKGLYPSDTMNKELGRQKGILTFVMFAFDLRNPDRSKGMRGQELPKPGTDLKLTMNVSNAVTVKDSGKTVDRPEEELQPYYWSVVSESYYQGVTDRNPENIWIPGRDWYSFADSMTQSSEGRRVFKNGTIEVAQSRHADHTQLDITIHDWKIDVNKFPIHTFNSTGSCSTALMDASCTDLQVGEISTGSIFYFSPTQIDGQDLDVYYQQDAGLKSTITTPSLEAVSMTGVRTVDQAVRTDDEKSTNFTMYPKGKFSMLTKYACSTLPYAASESNGTDCGGWRSSDSKHGTDKTVRGLMQRIQVAGDYSSSNTAALSTALPVSLVKIDPRAFEFTGDLHLAHPIWSDPAIVGGVWKVSGNRVVGSPDKTVTVKYATKRDGSSWRDDEEQKTADIPDLDYWDSLDEARQHGIPVGLLMVSRDVDPIGGANKYLFPSFMVRTRVDAVPGSTAQLTQVAHMWTREDLISKGVVPDGLTVDSPRSTWQEWARTVDPMELLNNPATAPTYGDNSKSYRKATYTTNGNYVPGMEGERYGDTILIASETAKTGVTTAQSKTDGSIGKNLYDLDREQRTIDWRTTINVDTPNVPEASKPMTTVRMTVTVPKGLTYVDGSAVVDGTYRESTPGMGQVTGGRTPDLLSQSVDTNTGSTILVFEVDPVKSSNSGDHYLYLSTTIGDPTSPDKDVKNGESFTLTSSIMSTGDVQAPTTENGKLSSYTVKVTRTKASELTTRANPLINEVNSVISFKNTVSNSSNDPKSNVMAIGIIPRNRIAGSKFDGSLSMQSMKLTGSGVDLSTIIVRVTTDPGDGNVDSLKSITRDEAQSWDRVTVRDDGTIDYGAGDPATVTGFSVEVPVLGANSRLEVEYGALSQGSLPGNVFVNRWTDYDNEVSCMAFIANRSVSGIVFIDMDRDGTRGSTDKLLPGIRVRLVSSIDPTSKTIDLLDGKPASTVTDANGRYSFDCIPAGSYSVVFEPKDGSSWADWRLTVKQAPGVDSSSDSDAEGSSVLGKLDKVGIKLAPMPSLEDMASSRYADTHKDVGLIPVVVMTSMPVTGSSDGLLPMLILCGVVLTVCWAGRVR